MEIEEKHKNKRDDKVIIKETSKNRNLIAKLRDNPTRLLNLKESLKYFTLLKKNHYLERKRHRPCPDDIMVCNCTPCPEEQIYLRPQGPQYSYNCGDRCLNRFTCTECDVDLCPCGELCRNRRFQRHQDACVYPIRMGGKGWGLAAGERIQKGQFVMQYIGEIFYTQSNIGRRRTLEYSKSTCTYLMKINSHEVIDPTYKGNLARFINHSCDPNCITVKWNVLGEVCIGIFANRDITEDEEFTFDYQFDAYNTPLTKCLCGTDNCKGYLGLKPTNFAQEKWEEHLENMLCKICESKMDDDDEALLLLCDKCNCGFHMFCLKPKLDSVPKDAWYCADCLEEMQGEDEKERERQQLETLAQQKLRILARQQRRNAGIRKTLKNKTFQSESEETESSDDESKKHSDDEEEAYETSFKEIKQLEEQAAIELILQNIQEKQNNIKPEIPSPPLNEDKPQLKRQDENQEYIKKKQKNLLLQNEQSKLPTEQSKQMQLANIVDEAHTKFTQALKFKIQIIFFINKVNQFIIKLFYLIDNTDSTTDMMKDCIRVNILEQKVVRKNAALMYKIGHKTSFEQVDSDNLDFFKKENDLTIIGTSNQIVVFREIFTLIETIIKELKRELGIVEGQIKVPVLFLKRLVLGFPQLEAQHKAAHMEEIFPLDKTTWLKIKGPKLDIQSCVMSISQRIKSLTVQRLYISRSETKTVQQNPEAEIRISRDSVHRGEHLQRDINHPFFYIQFREKEVCLIGTQKQIDETSQTLKRLLDKERASQADKEVTYFTVLVNPSNKESCKTVKSTMERQSSSVKVLLFEASHPRKNLTILVLCLRSQIDLVRKQFTELVNQQCSFRLDHFQDQMSMQMCRYVFKYLQNTMMTQEMAFMKNWDLITPYFFRFNIWKKDFTEENWFLKRCGNSLPKDYETQLYIQYILGSKIAFQMNEHDRNTRKKNVILLMKRILQSLQQQKKNNEKSDRHEGEYLNFMTNRQLEQQQQELKNQEALQELHHDTQHSATHSQASEDQYHKTDIIVPQVISPARLNVQPLQIQTMQLPLMMDEQQEISQNIMNNQKPSSPDSSTSSSSISFNNSSEPQQKSSPSSQKEDSVRKHKHNIQSHGFRRSTHRRTSSVESSRYPQDIRRRESSSPRYHHRYKDNKYNKFRHRYPEGFYEKKRSKSRERISKNHHHHQDSYNRNSRKYYTKHSPEKRANHHYRQRENNRYINLHHQSPVGIIANYNKYLGKPKQKLQHQYSSSSGSRRNSSRSRSRQHKRVHKSSKHR